MRGLLLSPFVALAILASHTAAQSPAPSSEEYLVFSVALDSLYSDQAREAILVSDSTLSSIPFGPQEIYETAVNQLHLPPGLAQSFREQNRNAVQLDHTRFRTLTPVVLLGTDERMIVGELALDLHEYPEDYPARGLISFSRVGFANDMQTALVHVLYHCGGRCGEGKMILLINQDGRWGVQNVTSTMAF